MGGTHQSYDGKVQRTEDLALDAMTKFVTDTPLTLLSKDDVFPKGDSTIEVLGVVEGDAT